MAALDPEEFAPVLGADRLAAMPGVLDRRQGPGRFDKPRVIACAHELAAGHDSRAEHAGRLPRPALAADRRAAALGARAAAPLDSARAGPARARACGRSSPALLAVHGYHATAGVLSAEQYGVPQTRKRAFLIASLDGPGRAARPDAPLLQPAPP